MSLGPKNSAHPLLTGHTRLVLFVVIGEKRKVCRQLGNILLSNNYYEKRQATCDLVKDCIYVTYLFTLIN